MKAFNQPGRDIATRRISHEPGMVISVVTGCEHTSQLLPRKTRNQKARDEPRGVSPGVLRPETPKTRVKVQPVVKPTQGSQEPTVASSK